MPAPALSERDLTVLRSFARRIDPSDAGAHNNLGVLYYQKGLIEEAIAEFARALELDSKMQVAQTNLEIAYRDSGHYDRRIADLSEVARSRPQDRTARWELGRAYATVGRHDEAIVEFEALLAHHPNDIPALIQLGLADKARGRLDAASGWLARACAEDPSNAVARFHHGEVLYNRGLSEPALASLKEAIARNPDYAEAHYLLAFVYGDLGQHEAARAATKRAVALNPMLARAQANLAIEGRAAERRGGGAVSQNGTARPGSERPGPLPTRPAGPQPVAGAPLAHYNLGVALRQKGYHDDALREYKAGLDAGEDRRLNLQAMAEVHLLRRDLTAALALYDALVKEFPESPKMWNERGVCLHQAGKRAEALASYEKAVVEQRGRHSGQRGLERRRRSGLPPGAGRVTAALYRPAQSGASPVPAPAEQGRAGRISAGSHGAARQLRRMEWNRSGTGGAQAVGGCTECLRARGRCG
jgi:tetratricopeptide (TPR) repeat protein